MDQNHTPGPSNSRNSNGKVVLVKEEVEDEGAMNLSKRIKTERSDSSEDEEDYCEIITQALEEHYTAQPNSQNSQKGPIYPYKEGTSFTLYMPPSDQLYSPSNPKGIVPVVVHPKIAQNGRGATSTGNSKIQRITKAQKEGLQFLWNSYAADHGCILAHEMGLGKTYTFFALIFTLFEQSEESRGHSRPSASKVIILSPKSVVDVWEGEIKKRTPKDGVFELLKIIPYLRESVVFDLLDKFYNEPRKKILLMSYDSFKKWKLNLLEYETQIDLIVCDEAHLLKNDLTQRVKSLRDDRIARVLIGLTGTPYQNNLTQFCTLLNIFRPDLMPSSYKQKYCRPIESFSRKISLNREISDAERTNIGLKINEIREKSRQILQYKSNNYVVNKHEFIICVSLAKGRKALGLQHQMYKEFTDFMRLNPPKAGEDGQGRISSYKALHILYKIIIHPKLAYMKLRSEPLPQLQEIAEKYEKKEAKLLNNLKKKRQEKHWDMFGSGKIQLLFKILAKIDVRNKEDGNKNNPDRVVIASCSKKLLNIISDVCKLQTYQFVRLDGDLKNNQRSEVIKNFQDGSIFIFLLSAKAGGSGITLHAANHLILMEPGWNPSDDRQVIHRIYREGQKKDCFIYRLFSTGTIEESQFLNQLTKEEMDYYFKKEDNDPINEYHLESMNNTMENYFTYYKGGEESFIKNQLGEKSIEDQDFAMKYSEPFGRYDNMNDLGSEPELGILKASWKSSMDLKFPISFILHDKIEAKNLNDDIDEEVIMEMARKTPRRDGSPESSGSSSTDN